MHTLKFANAVCLGLLCACAPAKLAYVDREATATKKDLLQSVSIAGKLEAIRVSSVVAAYQGYVRKVFVKVGETIQKGDPMISISSNLEEASGFFPMRAPFTGKITQITVKEGEFVAETGREEKLLIRLEDTSRFELNVEVPELDLPKIAIGQKAKVHLAALPGHEFGGIVQIISLSPKTTANKNWGEDTQSRYVVSIALKESSPDFRSGMSAFVDIQTAERKSVLALPGEFLTEREGAEAVKLKDGTYRKISVGLRTDDAFEVKSGLKEGETVVMDTLGGDQNNAR